MERTVIRNAIVLSMDPTIGEHLDADVLIEGEKIAYRAIVLGNDNRGSRHMHESARAAYSKDTIPAACSRRTA